MSNEIAGRKIWARGIVQGVGFRPFIYTKAVHSHLTGWVRNTSNGVEIEINGRPEDIQGFIHTLQTSLPPLARIDEIDIQPCPPNGYTIFEIIASKPQPGEFIPVSPDISICADCRRELFDPQDRRFRYPFINCTNCGPRFSIIQDIPYDRPLTTMAGFEMCPTCRQEYENPLDRRFHAQPIACPQCGPGVWLEAGGERIAAGEQAIQTARRWIVEGKILAVKGLGGFHLACDATNPTAVDSLRERKHRVGKPFALMAFDLDAVRRNCHITLQDEDLLLARQRPVVLLERAANSPVVPDVAPRQQTLGVMLAYTPLHLLLMEPASGFPDLLVMTSGNLSEEPICFDDDDARRRLDSMADGYLLHNRPIHMRVDDSVLRVAAGQPYLLRRARGYAPDAVPLIKPAPPILAVGAELKNTFCLTRRQYAFVSHHIGDLENYETLKSFEEGIRHYQQLFHIRPESIVCDLHPDYLSTRYAEQRSREEDLPLVQIQHHHAHLTACLADNGWSSPEPVIGLSFDGTGLGTDGAIWGGEFLLGGYREYRRVLHLAYTPLPGGDLAVRKPARMALAHLWQAGIDWEPGLPPVDTLCLEERTALRTQLEKHINAPLTSSIGRFFDAASALLGLRQTVTYEGQAAIELEAVADPCEEGLYPLEITGDRLDPAPLWQALLIDLYQNTPVPILAARFHNSIVAAAVEGCLRIRQQSSSRVVALSGGVWQNRFLLERTVKALQRANFAVLLHHQLPANDGCISLGQAVAAAAFREA